MHMYMYTCMYMYIIYMYTCVFDLHVNVFVIIWYFVPLSLTKMASIHFEWAHPLLLSMGKDSKEMVWRGLSEG